MSDFPMAQSFDGFIRTVRDKLSDRIRKKTASLNTLAGEAPEVSEVAAEVGDKRERGLHSTPQSQVRASQLPRFLSPSSRPIPFNMSGAENDADPQMPGNGGAQNDSAAGEEEAGQSAGAHDTSTDFVRVSDMARIVENAVEKLSDVMHASEQCITTQLTAKLETELSNIKEHVSIQLTGIKEYVRTEVAAMSTRMSTMQDTITHLASESASQKAQIRELQDEVSGMKARDKVQELDLKMVSDGAAFTRKEIRIMQDKILEMAATHERVQDLQGQVDQLHAVKVQMQDIGEAQRQMQALADRVNELHAKAQSLSDTEQRIQNLQDQVTQLARNHASMASQSGGSGGGASPAATSGVPQVPLPPPPPGHLLQTFNVVGVAEEQNEDTKAVVERALRESGVGDFELLMAKRLRAPTEGKPGRPRRIQIKVNSVFDAERIVKGRRKLGGKGIQIFDVLTWEEQKRHNDLWSLFKSARENKRKAYFERARLFVEKEGGGWAEVHPPVTAA